ncbi:unnamed protein product [Rotaria sordida]|uniref:DNA-dependent protein kinase catalytic subunit CC3 domain-containing protein n=2 Tax=Rotaria sordida TaxID=392033 RepID=A0A819JNE6_9BILA|nr:unnamed protein product [Rotaria sordida]CAF3936698.1 unnamed protein product [Rotaria sordida]
MVKNSLFRTEHRLNALEKLILKILIFVRKIILIKFYKKYICTLVIDELDIKLDLTSQTLISILINKVCTYRLINHIYIYNIKKILNVEIPITAIKIGQTYDDKELTKHINTRVGEQFVDGRLMKTMDVMLARINTNDKQIKLYLIRSLTTNYKYKFSFELERYYAKDKRILLNILCKTILTTSKTDNSLHQQRLSSTPHYLSLKYLFGCSLTDELAVFDFILATVNQQQNDLNKTLIEGSDDEIGSEFIDMEMNERNLHPCMVPMVCLLKHMETNGIIPINDHISDIPLWMICMYKKFSDPLISFNIKLFLMRLIIDTHTIFKPYARYWLTPIIHMCNQMFENSSEGLNTFIIDTIVILLSWHKQAIPSELDSIAIQRFIEYLFSNFLHRNVIVMKSNLDLIKKLIECWKERIHAPTLILYKLISEPDLKSKQNAIGLSLIGILLANDILPYYVPPTSTGNLPPVTTNSILTTIPNNLTEDKFNDIILKNMKNTYRNIYAAAAAEVIGMLLNVKKLKHKTNQRLLEQINLILKWHNSQGLLDTYVTCIYSIQKHYPLIVDKTVMNKLIFGLKKMYGDIKIECLESLIANITEFDSAYLELRAAGILDILIHKDFGIRGVALRLLYKLLPKLTHEQLYEIAQILYVDGPNKCQIWTFEIYKWIYDYITNYLTKEIKTSITPLSEIFYHHVREQLLQLLSSKNEYIRVNCRNFWCDSKRLSTSSHHRLIALVDQLYSIKTENEYLNYCTNFLLERTTHNPDYNHFIFENQLDKCLFQEFPLTCYWRQSHHTYITPLFTL